MLEEISNLGDIDLDSYDKLKEIASKLGGLLDSDKEIVNAELQKKIDEYNALVNVVNTEFEESKSIENSFFFSAAISTLSLWAIGLKLLKRRFF